MNYQITCICGHKFLINDEQLTGHVACPACNRALSPVVSPHPPASAPAVPASAPCEDMETSMTNPMPQEPTKRCPFCGEVILAIARKCKHCGEFLDRAPAPPAAPNGNVIPLTPASQTPAPAPGAVNEDPPVFDLSVSQWDNIWRFLICGIITIVVCWVLITFFRNSAALGVPVTLVIMSLIAWFFYLSAKKSRCIIRTVRIETEVGVLTKDLNSLELFRVTDLALNQNLLERLIGIGSIKITSNDPNTPELLLYQIPQAKKVYKYLQQQVPIVTRQRGAVLLER